ncbi:MAG: sugar phosphate isomerase/epimerase, partial [Planctomycetaceae bacterium]|nr:sugar phosphate isomerase/epimerase [Planctomycetaceae bacterium]
MEIETIISEPKPESLKVIENCCNEFNINVALHNHDAQSSPDYWSPEKVLEHCKNYGFRIGVCADLGYWMRSGIDPVESVRVLKNRLLTVQVHDLDQRNSKGKDVPWGTGKGMTQAFFEELFRQGIRPLDIDLEYSEHFENNMIECRKCIEFFNAAVSNLP